MGSGQSWVGTSGWNYKHWRGDLYPSGLPVAKWLQHYSTLFSTVEINNSFYRIPPPGTMASWASQTPPLFRFAPKLWRGITHYRRLRNCAEFLEQFFLSVNELEPVRRGPLLVQLPPQQGKDLPRLVDFLDDLRANGGDQWLVAVEFRNNEWNSLDVDEALAARSVAVCIHDMAGRGAREAPTDAPFVYVRRHGSQNRKYAGSYGEEETARDAEAVVQWLIQGRDVYVYFNNDIGGHAIHNAQSLIQLIAPASSLSPAY